MRFSLLLLAPLLIGASPATAPSTEHPAHDRDPWIFRCVLDGNARMVVVSLGHDVWAAYDANRCRLAKVWTGKVEFTGPVFDTRHGPQPKSNGTMLLDRPASLAPATDASTAQASDKELEGFRGYSIHGDLATIKFDFGGVTVEETPSATVNEADHTVTFKREIKVTSKSSEPIMLATPTSAKVKSILVAGGSAQQPLAPPLPHEVKFDAEHNATLQVTPGQSIFLETTVTTD